MPELPEVETIRRGMAETLEGKKIARVTVRRGDLRFPLPKSFAARLAGRKFARIRRRAKYILADLDDGDTLILHLGMSGQVLISGKPPRTFEKHNHVTIECTDDTTLVFNDARRFGMMDLCRTGDLAKHRLLKNLGPEPLEKSFTGASLYEALKEKTANIKAALMDARIVAGVGNIYASESLFRAHISPKRKAGTLSRKEADALARAVKAVLKEAIASGGSTLRDYVRSSGDLGYFQHRFRVYGRAGKPCPACGAPIRRIVQQSRSTFHCPGCQD